MPNFIAEDQIEQVPLQKLQHVRAREIPALVTALKAGTVLRA